MEKFDKLWQQLKNESYSQVRLMGSRSSFLLSKNDFEKYKSHFIYSGGFLRGGGFRTKETLKHIHAKMYEKCVELHIDYGNVAKMPFLCLIHFFTDVMPYIIFCLIKYKRFSFTPISLHKKKLLEELREEGI